MVSDCYINGIASYYKNLPIKPGVDIYKAILESKIPFNRLGVKIPETLATFDNLYWIGYDYEKGESFIQPINDWAAAPKLSDRSNITEGTKYKGFVDTLEYTDTIYYKHLDIERGLDPACISRSCNNYPVSESVEVISWEKLYQIYTYGPNAPGILQRFIYSPTHKATLYRLVYHNPRNSSETSNFGYCLANKKNYWSAKTEIEAR